MEADSERFKDQIIFCTILQTNNSLAKQYEKLKQYYIDYDDHLFYSMNKEPFVNKVVDDFKQ
jgi:GrpB-like predicted nucleotidyltransferase (UPF0157 family)